MPSIDLKSPTLPGMNMKMNSPEIEVGKLSIKERYRLDIDISEKNR